MIDWWRSSVPSNWQIVSFQPVQVEVGPTNHANSISKIRLAVTWVGLYLLIHGVSAMAMLRMTMIHSNSLLFIYGKKNPAYWN